jgi:ubiquinone/menaquinone biosynthesis C-methylase UbiE
MGNEKPLSPELEPSYFQLQAYWGATKHMGGLKATKELVQLCHITKDKHVLDVGCGVGITSIYITKHYDCKVIGIDISPKMIERSKERAEKEGVDNKTEFIVADAQNLPFPNNHFNTVIAESTTAFLQHKQTAINEYRRVTKPNGYVGLNETTWLKTPPPTDLAKYFLRTTSAKPETPKRWKKLLETSRLKNIVAITYKVNILSEYINRIKQVGTKDFSRAVCTFLSLYISSPAFRKYARKTLPPIIIKNIFQYLGYGIYVGKK